MLVCVAPETFSNTGPLFPLKNFMGLPTHHIMHSLPYWLLKVALNTMPGAPHQQVYGLPVSREAPVGHPRASGAPVAAFPAKMMKRLFCLVELNIASMLNKAGSIAKCHKLLFQRCLLLFEGKNDYNGTPTPNTPLYCVISACTKVFHIVPKNERKSFIIKVVSISFRISGIT